MAETLEAGREFELKREVTPELTADRYGNPGAFVFATPMLVGLLEEAAIRCVAEALEPDAATVGTRVDVEHKAATPVGLTVTARARLIEVDRRRLVFEVEAHDDRELIATGTHERFVLKSLSKFLESAAQKAS
ncbi:MAG: thioesterase family protein [bacterium]|nr:thioesterase family protein [bacterium]